jgi:hypothetical protein
MGTSRVHPSAGGWAAAKRLSGRSVPAEDLADAIVAASAAAEETPADDGAAECLVSLLADSWDMESRSVAASLRHPLAAAPQDATAAYLASVLTQRTMARLADVRVNSVLARIARESAMWAWADVCCAGAPSPLDVPARQAAAHLQRVLQEATGAAVGERFLGDYLARAAQYFLKRDGAEAFGTFGQPSFVSEARRESALSALSGEVAGALRDGLSAVRDAVREGDEARARGRARGLLETAWHRLGERGERR